MNGRDQRRRKYYRNNLHSLFHERLDATELMPYLSCLSEADKQSVRCKHQNHGQRQGYIELSHHLLRRDEWFEQLWGALKAVEQNRLASMLEKCDDGNFGPPEYNHISSARAAASTSSSAMLRNQVYNSSSLISHMPSDLSSILKLLGDKTLRGWDDFISQFGYTVSENVVLEQEPDKFKTLLRDLRTKEVTLGQLLKALVSISRLDLIEEVFKRYQCEEELKREIRQLCQRESSLVSQQEASEDQPVSDWIPTPVQEEEQQMNFNSSAVNNSENSWQSDGPIQEDDGRTVNLRDHREKRVWEIDVNLPSDVYDDTVCPGQTSKRDSSRMTEWLHGDDFQHSTGEAKRAVIMESIIIMLKLFWDAFEMNFIQK